MSNEPTSTSSKSREELNEIIGNDPDALKRSFEHLLREIAPLKETD